MRYRAPRKYRVVVLCDERLVPPHDSDGLTEKEIQPVKTEFDVITTLEYMGHDVKVVGVGTDLGVIRAAISKHKPHVVFNLLEEFSGNPLYDQHVVSYLELLKQSYTGCNPRGLTLAHDKALSKKILAFHRINVPNFTVYPIGSKVRKSSKHRFPMIVKSLVEHGSVGLSQKSLVYDERELRERVEFMHKHHDTHVIAEQFIEGRELYVAIMGNRQLTAYPVWELRFNHLREGAPKLATDRVKWSYDYQKKVGVMTRAARDLPRELERRIFRTAKNIYRVLNCSGYARIDFRLTADERLYLLEANPNPNLSYGEDFAEAAEFGGVKYEELLQKIMTLGISYQPTGVRADE